MKRARLTFLPWLLIGIAAPGCTGTETGNPPRASISFSLDSSDLQNFSVGTDSGGVKITDARIGVQALSVTECKTKAVTNVAETSAVDLRNGASVFELPQEKVCELELTLEPIAIDWASVHPGAPSELSLGMAGVIPPSAGLFVEDTATPRVIFRPSSVDVADGTQLLLSLDVATVLNVDEILQTAPDNNGDAVINSQQNASILASIQSRWPTAWRLYSVTGGGGVKLLATGAAQ